MSPILRMSRHLDYGKRRKVRPCPFTPGGRTPGRSPTRPFYADETVGTPRNLDPSGRSRRLRRAVRDSFHHVPPRLERGRVRGAAGSAQDACADRALSRQSRPAHRPPASSSTGLPPTRPRFFRSRCGRTAVAAASPASFSKNRCGTSTARARAAFISKSRMRTRRRLGLYKGMEFRESGKRAGYYTQGRATPASALVMLRQLR